MPRTSKIKYNPTISVEENAKRNGVSVAAIRNYIKVNNLDRRYERKQNIIADCKKYLKKHPKATREEIHQNTGYSLTTIRQYWEYITTEKELTDFNENKMQERKNKITSSREDDKLLTSVTEKTCLDIKEKYLCQIPDTWNFECGTKKLSFKDIKEAMINEGISITKADSYYGGNSSIETDANIIWLTMYINGKKIRKPLFMGEMKKQGTNDKRISEGKKKQAIGNAGPDRVAKNFEIASDFCYLKDKDFFPYNVFLHGCDFKESEITGTTKAKLKPFFGKLNILNPYFDKDIFWSRKGGSCFFQGDKYTHEQLYDVCFKCCEIGIKHYMSKYNINKMSNF